MSAAALRTRARWAARVVRGVGVVHTPQYRVQLARARRGRPGTLRAIRAKDVRHPLWFRAGTSDMRVFEQIFIDRDYDPVAQLPSPLIIDCGANVGYASALFLSRFPGAALVAVEPDPSNFSVLERNLAPYDNPIRLVEGAVWSSNTTLSLEEAPYRDGEEWSRQVTASRGPGAVRAYDIPTLLAESGHDRIGLLKVDIEGAECELFGAASVGDWIDRVDSIAVELHDDSHFGKATAVFERAVAGLGFTLTPHADWVLATRR